MSTRVRERFFRNTLLPEEHVGYAQKSYVFEILRDLCVLCGEKSALGAVRLEGIRDPGYFQTGKLSRQERRALRRDCHSTASRSGDRSTPSAPKK